MMMMKSVIWWRKPEYPEETTDLRQVVHTYASLKTKFNHATKFFDMYDHLLRQGRSQAEAEEEAGKHKF